MRETLSCIACGRKLFQVDDRAGGNQPYLATEFVTHGHYGSTAYDPMDGHYIVVNICDACLTMHPDRVLEGRDKRPVILEGAIVGWEDVDWKPVPWQPSRVSLEHTLEEALADFNILDPANPDGPVHGISVEIKGAVDREEE